jgi:hypothetical protein
VIDPRSETGAACSGRRFGFAEELAIDAIVVETLTEFPQEPFSEGQLLGNVPAAGLLREGARVGLGQAEDAQRAWPPFHYAGRDSPFVPSTQSVST